MRVAIVGPGAMGRLFAALLSRTASVVLVDKREKRALNLTKHGFRLSGLTNGHFRIRTTTRPEGDFDAVIVMVKAFSTAEVADKLPQWAGSASVLTLQNGMGNAEKLAQALGEERLVVGVTSYGANISPDNPMVVHHAGVGPTTIGVLTRKAEKSLALFENLLQGAGIDVRVAEDIKPVLWEKLLINAAINPVCALLRIRNGQLPALEEAWRLAANLAREGEAVASAVGVQIPSSILETIRDVCEKTASNRCSTLQDVLAGRPTEIPYINGHIVKQARRYGIPAPHNSAINALFEAWNGLHRPGVQTDGNS